jgi:hypothetical protein
VIFAIQNDSPLAIRLWFAETYDSQLLDHVAGFEQHETSKDACAAPWYFSGGINSLLPEHNPSKMRVLAFSRQYAEREQATGGATTDRKWRMNVIVFLRVGDQKAHLTIQGRRSVLGVVEAEALHYLY